MIVKRNKDDTLRCLVSACLRIRPTLSVRGKVLEPSIWLSGFEISHRHLNLNKNGEVTDSKLDSNNPIWEELEDIIANVVDDFLTKKLGE